MLPILLANRSKNNSASDRLLTRPVAHAGDSKSTASCEEDLPWTEMGVPEVKRPPRRRDRALRPSVFESFD